MNPNPFSFENHLTVPVSTSDNDVLLKTASNPSDAGTRTPDNVSSERRVCKEPAAKPRGLHGAAEEQRDRHRAGASGHRCEVARDVGHLCGDVTPDPLVRARQPDVQYGRARLDHV